MGRRDTFWGRKGRNCSGSTSGKDLEKIKGSLPPHSGEKGKVPSKIRLGKKYIGKEKETQEKCFSYGESPKNEEGR